MDSLIYNPEFVISFLLGIIGIILSVYFYYRGRKFRQISYTCETNNVTLNNTPFEKLSFAYNGEPMTSISITDVIIWCSGKEIINRNDIAPLSPLTIHTPAKILDYKLILSNEPCNNFQICRKNDHELTFDFDYICKNNGIAVRVIHAGGCENFHVTCKIKDGRKTAYTGHRRGYFYAFLNNRYVKRILSRKFTSFIFIVFTIFLFPNAFIQSANYADNNYFGFPSNSIFMNLDSIVIFILCTCSFLLSIPHIFNLFKSDPPDDLINCTTCER